MRIILFLIDIITIVPVIFHRINDQSSQSYNIDKKYQKLKTLSFTIKKPFETYRSTFKDSLVGIRIFIIVLKYLIPNYLHKRNICINQKRIDLLNSVTIIQNIGRNNTIYTILIIHFPVEYAVNSSR